MTPHVRRWSAVLSVAAAGSLAAQSSAPVAQQFEKLHFRSIGPAIMSGRISDFAVYEKNPAIWYVATGHGGVWKTTSNGALLTPIFEDKGLMSIGDVTVSQTNPDVVWVGTGESNNRKARRGLCRALAERQAEGRHGARARKNRLKSSTKKEKRRRQIPLWYARLEGDFLRACVLKRTEKERL
jgi:hypothetical protein